jgi:hypothetical protein
MHLQRVYNLYTLTIIIDYFTADETAFWGFWKEQDVFNKLFR